MKNALFLLLFLVFTVPASSQGIHWEVRTGFGFYNLKDIKSFQLDLMKATNLTHIKAVEKFPPNIFYSVSSDYFFNDLHTVGFDYTYYTTGGRNHIKDYSGEYQLDMLANGHRIGAKYMISTNLYNKLNLGVQLGGGCIFSNLNIDEHLKVVEEVITNEGYEFTGLGFYIEPSVVLSYHLLKGTSIHLMGGYEQDFKEELHVKENKDQKIGKTADWSGLKISLGINYRLDFEKKSREATIESGIRQPLEKGASMKRKWKNYYKKKENNSFAKPNETLVQYDPIQY